MPSAATPAKMRFGRAFTTAKAPWIIASFMAIPLRFFALSFSIFNRFAACSFSRASSFTALPCAAAVFFWYSDSSAPIARSSSCFARLDWIATTAPAMVLADESAASFISCSNFFRSSAFAFACFNSSSLSPIFLSKRSWLNAAICSAVYSSSSTRAAFDSTAATNCASVMEVSGPVPWNCRNSCPPAAICACKSASVVTDGFRSAAILSCTAFNRASAAFSCSTSGVSALLSPGSRSTCFCRACTSFCRAAREPAAKSASSFVSVAALPFPLPFPFPVPVPVSAPAPPGVVPSVLVPPLPGI